jgi:hypothetical protein
MVSIQSRKPSAKAKIQNSEEFIKAALELGCDEDPAHFDEILKKVARHKPPEPSQAFKNPKSKKPGQ